MALEALSSNELLNFIIYDTISATPCVGHLCSSDSTNSLLDYSLKPQEHAGSASNNKFSLAMRPPHSAPVGVALDRPKSLAAVQSGRKKRRRRPNACKNREEAETQRMTHIAVERNRRRQMNDHLAVLRSLMPDSYIRRGDQASIVGGAIEFVKELEQLLQSLEAQKLQIPGEGKGMITRGGAEDSMISTKLMSPPPFSQFFIYPQYTWSQIPSKHTSESKEVTADIEVTLIETHANLRILLRRKPRQLLKMVIGFQTLHLTILHLSVTTLDQLVLYSISAQVEEECQLTSADDIAAAVHHMLRIIEGEAALC